MRFDEFIADYRRREKMATSLTYDRFLRPFDKWLTNKQLPGAFGVTEINRYLDAKRWTNRTKNIFLSAIRGWADYQKARIPGGQDMNEVIRYRADEKLMDSIMGLRNYTERVSSREALTLSEITTLLRAATPWDYQTIWSLLYLGVRSKELITIKEEDVKTIDDAGNAEVTVISLKQGVIGATRQLFVDEYSAVMLRSIVNECYRKYTHLRPGGSVAKYANLIAPKQVTPHTMRHSFASYFQPIVSEPVLRYMMGHSAHDITGVYTHPLEGAVKDAMLNLHWMRPLEPPSSAAYYLYHAENPPAV
jgi:integrase